MNRPDARKLISEVQQHNRDLAIHLYQQGQPRKSIAEIVDVHYGVVCSLIRAWKAGGRKGIQLGQRGCMLLLLNVSTRT